MAFVLPRLSSASVPFVQEGARSEHFELAKLVEGEIDGLFAVEGVPGFVVKASNRFWRFDAQGVLVGQTRRTRVTAGGASFGLVEPKDSTGSWRVFRQEWLLTGSEARHELPVTAMASQERFRLVDLLERSTAVARLRGGSSRVAGFRGLALRLDGAWQGFDLSSWDDAVYQDLPLRTEEVKDRESELWEVHDVVGSNPPGPFPLHLARDVPDGPESLPALEATDFSRRSVEFSDGFGGWVFWKTIGWWLLAGYPGQPPYAYWGGVGTFAFQHQGETLRFRATASLGELGEDGVAADNLRLLELPGDLKLLRVYSPGKRHSKFYTRPGLEDQAHDEVGLYLVRRRGGPPQPALAGSWLPEVQGLTWGTWQYPSGNVDFGPGIPAQAFAQAPESLSESQHDMPRGGRVVPQPFRQIPSNLRLRLPVRHGSTPAALAVDLGDRRWHFVPPEDLELDVSLDRTEFAKAWETLGGGDLRLVANFQSHKQRLLEEGSDDNTWVRPTLALVGRRATVELPSVRWSATSTEWPREHDDRERFLLSRTWQAGKLARAGKLSAAGWIEVTRDLLRDAETVEEKAVWLVHAANELLNASSSARDEETSRLLVEFWRKELHPAVRDLADAELAKAGAILTSNSLGNAVHWRDSSLSGRIVEELVDKNRENIQHGTLHYNLACYHAWRLERPALLEAVRRARALGKPASQFRADPDFETWLSDAEFVKALEDVEERR